MPASRRQDRVILRARIMLFIPFAQQGLPCRFGSEKQQHAGMRLLPLTCGCFYINKKGAKKGVCCAFKDEAPVFGAEAGVEELEDVACPGRVPKPGFLIMCLTF